MVLTFPNQTPELIVPFCFLYLALKEVEMDSLLDMPHLVYMSCVTSKKRGLVGS